MLEELYVGELDRIMSEDFLADVHSILETAQFSSVTREMLLDPGQSKKEKLGEILLLWKEANVAKSTRCGRSGTGRSIAK